MKTVLIACHNPTLQGEVVWEGHTILGYVDITPPLRTQKERQEYFQEELNKIDEEEIRTKEELNKNIDEDERESGEQHLEELSYRREEIVEESSQPLDVERLSKQYYQGWSTIPKDLQVDIVFTAFCPLDLDRYEITSFVGIYDDVFIKAVEFLKPGGQLIITQNTKRRQPLLEKSFRVQYAQQIPIYPEDMKTPVMILTKKTGGSKKTRRSKNTKRRTRRR